MDPCSPTDRPLQQHPITRSEETSLPEAQSAAQLTVLPDPQPEMQSEMQQAVIADAAPTSNAATSGHADSIVASLQLVESFADAYAFFNGDEQLQHWSATLADFFPSTTARLKTGLSLDAFLALHLSSGDTVSTLNRNAAKTRCSLANGKLIEARIVPLQNQGIVFACNDISHIQRGQEALRASDLKFRQFATLASNWFWELDENLCYKYHSSHCQPLAGTDPESLVGQPRIVKLDGMVVDNDQLREHNRCLLAHEDVDVVLTWTREDGKKIYSRILAKPQYHLGRFCGYLGCGRDVSAAYELREMLQYQADHDDLTGLLNRRAFAAKLDEAFAGRKNQMHHNALIKFDLDHFSLVNDGAGHQAGDAILKEVTALLHRETPKAAVIARLGGDEFGVYMQASPTTAQQYAERIIMLIDGQRFIWREQKFAIGASAGIAFIDDASGSSTVVIKNADAACYSAKKLGRNRALLFSPENYFHQQQTEERKKVGILQSAIDNDRLKLYLQPIVPSGKAETTSKYEVLLRIVDQDGQIISPGELIPVAEKFDLIQLVDMQVVHKSVELVKAFLSRQVDVALSINLSGNTLSNSACLRRIARLVKSSDLPAGALGFEITETSAIQNIRLVSHFIEQLRSMGCTFSIDDFGSGLSSYNYLNSLQADFLKIDGSFVSKIPHDKASLAIVKSINTLSHEMGMKTVAEFVESELVATTLREINIDYFQGFLCGRPERADDILARHQE
jgi:diguanylate cyclase (GGDEF)-like protein